MRWTEAGGLISLQAPSLGGNDIALAVNADGSVIAGRTRDHNPFRWTTATGFQLLTLDEGQINGLSGSGSAMAGMIGTPARAARWDGTSPPQALEASASNSYASGISADGLAVVGTVNNQNGTSRPFRWSASTGLVDLGLFGGATAISGDGSAVVGWGTPTQGGTSQAFRWRLDEGAVPLWTGRALATSGDGSVVVGSTFTPNPLDNRAMIWSLGLGPIDLRLYLESVGVTNLGGWTLLRANGISADGTVIVGDAINPSGQQEGFYAVIPTPATVLVAFAGLAASCRRRVQPARLR